MEDTDAMALEVKCHLGCEGFSVPNRTDVFLAMAYLTYEIGTPPPTYTETIPLLCLAGF